MVRKLHKTLIAIFNDLIGSLLAAYSGQLRRFCAELHESERFAVKDGAF
jgi:hypothetical protein